MALSTVRVVLGDASWFTHPDAALVSQCITQTWDDLEHASFMARPTSQWTVLWHHPDSPAGQRLLSGKQRDPAMRGLTLYAQQTIILVGNPTDTTRDRWHQIIRHEATHAAARDAYLDSNASWPWWLSEGIATLWEIKPIHGHPAMNPWRQPLLVHLNDSGQGLAIDHLLAFDGKSVRPQTLANNYARAWALVYYLHNTYPELLRQYMDGTRLIDHQWLKTTVGNDIPAIACHK